LISEYEIDALMIGIRELAFVSQKIEGLIDGYVLEIDVTDHQRFHFVSQFSVVSQPKGFGGLVVVGPCKSDGEGKGQAYGNPQCGWGRPVDHEPRLREN